MSVLLRSSGGIGETWDTFEKVRGPKKKKNYNNCVTCVKNAKRYFSFNRSKLLDENNNNNNCTTVVCTRRRVAISNNTNATHDTLSRIHRKNKRTDWTAARKAIRITVDRTKVAAETQKWFCKCLSGGDNRRTHCRLINWLIDFWFLFVVYAHLTQRFYNVLLYNVRDQRHV